MRLHFISALATLLALIAVPSRAVEVLDQQYDTESGIADSMSSGYLELAQTFTVGVAGTLKRVEAQLARPGFTTAGSVTLTVYSLSGGIPNAVLGTASLPWNSIPATGVTYQSFDVSSYAIPVSVSQQLAISFKSSIDNLFFWRGVPEFSTYAGGKSMYRQINPTGSWQDYGAYAHDNGFKTYVEFAGGLAGDYNNDSKVDAADYVMWRQNLGAPNETPINGNGNGSGGVDSGDFTWWRSHFAPGAGAWTITVPEPSTSVLMTMAWCGLALHARNRKCR